MSALFRVALHRDSPRLAPRSSSLRIKSSAEPLQCDTDTPISIQYVFTGETFNTDSLDIIYMVCVCRGITFLISEREGYIF